MKPTFFLFLMLLLAGCVQADPLPMPTPTRAPATETATQVPATRPPATLEPAATPTQPSVEATALPTTQPVSSEDERIADAPAPAPRDEIALAEAFRKTGPLPRVARTTPLEVQVGDIEQFWVSDLVDTRHYTVEAELRYAGPVVLMYVDTSLEVDQALIEQSARDFEQQIYPRNRQLFGNEPEPGIDGDSRLTVLNIRLRGAGGYFSSNDGIVKAANRFSNERDMFVINIISYPIGSNGYALTLAHEFQHMIHDNRLPGSATWFDEGMSTMAEDLNGYIDQGTPMLYLADPDVQLMDWTPIGIHYGLSQLFLRYMREQYTGDMGLAELIDLNAGNNIDAFAQVAARKRPDIQNFDDLYADWAVANLLNDPRLEDGRYAYSLLPQTVTPLEVQPGQQEASVHQYGADYLVLPAGPGTFSFDGVDTVSLTGAAPAEGSGAWWSNRADQRVSTLTRAFDLRNVSQATLELSAWYELERGYDYGFVSVSLDGGATWETLPGRTTTNDDPQGANFGNGLTGVSSAPGGDIGQVTRGKWVDEAFDLSAYAGREIVVRFWVTTDAAVNGAGLMIDNIRIDAIGFRDGAENDTAGWQSEGFVRTSGTLPQYWNLRLVRYGAQTVVEPVSVDAQGRAEITLNEGERAVLLVSGATRYTTEPAAYTYRVKES